MAPHFLPLLLAMLFLALTPVSFSQILADDFAYPPGDSITNHGWAVHSGSRGPVMVTADGLVHDGYTGSGIGGAALLALAGEDHHRTFPTRDSGDVFLSFLVRVDSLEEGFFIHFARSNTAFAARISLRDAGGSCQFGIANGATPTYGPARFSAGTTLLCIVKYTVSSAGACSLWVFDHGVPADEAAAGAPTATASGSGQSQISRICLRQYSNAQRIIVDGIRIASSWGGMLLSADAPPAWLPPAMRMDIHPNPAQGTAMLGFHLDERSTVHLSLWDILGRQVCMERSLICGPGLARLPLALDGLPSGSYRVLLRTPRAKAVQTIVKR